MARFTDIEGHWAEPYIEAAAEARAFNGYPDGTFRPDEPITRAQLATVLWNLEITHSVPQPEPEPEPEPGTPELIEPGLGNPDILEHYAGPSDVHGPLVIANKFIDKPIRIRSGVVQFANCHSRVIGGEYNFAGWGGRGVLGNCEVEGSKDGTKDNVDMYDTLIHNLYGDANAHADCVQLQSGGATAHIERCELIARYGYGPRNGEWANAAVIMKNDLGDTSKPQHVTIKDSYVDGGNRTLMLHTPINTYTLDNVEWGGNSRYGYKQGDAREVPA